MSADRALPSVEGGLAICYSGYREGQSPASQIYPSREHVLEDLRVLARRWRQLRMYDCSPHVETVLELIASESLPFTVMIGAYIEAEVSNPRCPWGGVYDDATLARNRESNALQIEKAIELANRYPSIVSSVSAGNEATVEWTDHLVPVDGVVEYVRRLRAGVRQPVTFCENYIPWQSALAPLVPEVDFVSLHTYPVWEYKSIDEAIGFTEENYRSVVDRHPGKPVVITEAGWPTRSNGRGIRPENASAGLQSAYLRALEEWSAARGVLTFVFEAFDEPWKGSDDPAEPEKHWGLFTVDRRPKESMRAEFGDAVDG